MRERSKTTAGLFNLSAGKIKTIPLPMASLDEQSEIIHLIDSLLEKEQWAKESAEAVLDQIDLMKKSILARAFRGELGKNDPSEESAVKLLRQVIEQEDGDVIRPKAKAKRIAIPAEIKPLLSGANEEAIVKLLLKAAPQSVSTQISKPTQSVPMMIVRQYLFWRHFFVQMGESTLLLHQMIRGSNVELVSTWRTKDPGLIELWNETRNKGALITEKLVIDGPFSENIGEGVLYSEIMDEVILCLNYDGKFGLNNMNSYFQNANTEKAVVWRDWKYKVGDHILFNDTDRFSLLYNNLKGRIVQIELFDRRIRFTVDVEIPLTEQDCQNDGIEFIDIIDDVTRIRFDVLDFEEEMADEDRKKAIVPFQLAYAVSIHKAQGLEYRSVKVVIPSSNAEKITHGIFYTAITRAKEKLKIYWSSETMQEVVAGFSVDTSRQKSLAIIKEKLKQDKNT